MRVRRRSHINALKQIEENHKEALKSHEAHVAEIREYNDEQLKLHKERVKEADRFNDEQLRIHREMSAVREASIEHNKKSIQYFEQNKESIRGKLKNLVSGPPDLVSVPDEPIKPEEFKIDDPHLLETPDPPEFNFDFADHVYEVEEVKKPTKVKTQWGNALATEGYILHGPDGSFVVTEQDFKSEYVEV